MGARLRTHGWLLAVGLLLGAGSLLRLWNLGAQVLTGDELHALNAALTRTPGEILRTWDYFGADYGVPLAALYRVAMDAGLVLGEWHLRAPALAASALTIALLPVWLRPKLGRAGAVALAALLALSPMLVLYGRMVRSYAPMVLLASAAVVAFERFARTRSPRAGAAYAAAATGAVHLHLASAPFVLAPFAWGALRALRAGPGRAPALRALAALGAVELAALAAVLLPAAPSLVALAGIHGEGGAPGPATWLGALRLQAGTPSWALAALLAAALARGARILVRRDPAFAGLLATAAGGQVAGLLVLGPNFLQELIVVNRYLLVWLPLLLAVAALGLAEPVAAGRRAAALQLAGAGALALALFASGPLARPAFRWSSYTHAQPFVNFLAEPDRIPLDFVPRFYREVPPGAEPLLEVPWVNVGSHAFAAYQALHRRPLRVVSLSRHHDDPRLALRNVIPARVDAILASGARFVVVHRDLYREERWVETTELQHRDRLERMPELWEALRRGGRLFESELRAALGPPRYEDGHLCVWDLRGAPRSGQGRAERPGADPEP